MNFHRIHRYFTLKHELMAIKNNESPNITILYNPNYIKYTNNMTNENDNTGGVGNPSNMTIPDFITKELFEKALKNGFNNKQIMITDLQVMMGSSSGDNYCSEIYRANITYTMSGIANKTISLIVKAMPFMEARGPVLEDLEVYDKEVKMYTDTLPKLSALLNNEYLCAKCFYATEDPVKMIIFEDLKSLGYKMADRHAGLDENHCKLVLSKLARFHAASMILAEQEPIVKERYSFGLFRPNPKTPEFLEAIFGNGLSCLIEVVETWPGYNSIFKKLQNIRIDFMKKVEKFCNDKPASIRVLNHGDLWINNMMFKYNSDDGGVVPIDVVFLDYQMSYYNSPGIDINYFISTSSMYEIREKKRYIIIESYYRTFVKALLELNDISKIISLNDMKNDIASREFYGFVASVSILPIVLLDKEASKESSMDNLVDEEASAKLRKAMYTGDNYVKSMKYLLKRFDELHVLDGETF